MDEPLDELYFRWLYSKVSSVRLRAPSRTHWLLLRILFTREFVWFVPNDDNRVEDGRDLRVEFLETEELVAVDEWMRLGCSMLEMLIGLSRRLSFETGGEPREWFWHLLNILKIAQYTDDQVIPEVEVNDILDTVIFRTYDNNGIGGLFPLNNAQKDQRNVELWYQMSSYLLERGY